MLELPDLPPGRELLGKRLLEDGQPADALPHLRKAHEANPFDLALGRQYFQALGEAGDGLGQRRLADEYRLLLLAAPGLIAPEAWIADVPPPGDELASIIVLAHNELDCTRLCLESVLRTTRPPYELILIDNASTDGTWEYFQALEKRHGPARVELIHNEANVGFPAGCNHGIHHARGRFLVFLNHDTVVVPGWLDGLIAWALSDWPRTGMVGPTCNYTAPPQLVPAPYRDLAGLEPFAARRRQELAGKALEVERLLGFCLLVRRDVLSLVGNFDTRYGLGFFDDDDLSLRVRQAGFKLKIAQEVYIHHFGSRTFRSLGIACEEHLRANFEQFKEKWGAEAAKGYGMPERESGGGRESSVVDRGSLVVDRESLIVDRGSLNALAGADQETERAPRVSLCMMVRNEEANLPACLESVAGIFDEMIIVDTGSTDDTRNIAARFGAKVVDFPWIDSFCAARNVGIENATGDWIFWLDADDRVDADNRERLRSLFQNLPNENVAFSMKCVCLPDPSRESTTVVDHIRLFRRDPALRWRYRVHEQILPAIRAKGGNVCFANIAIHHTGYQDPQLRSRKLERDSRLLQIELAEHPDDPFALFNLGSIYQELERLPEALDCLRRSLERSQPMDSIVRKLYAMITQIHRHLNQRKEAWSVCEAGRKLYPDDTELLFQQGILLQEGGNLAGAERVFQGLLNGRDGAYFASVDTGLRGFKARHNLALALKGQNRVAEAEAHWHHIVQEQPTFAPGWWALGEICLAQGRWPEVDQIAHRLESGAGRPQDAKELRRRLSALTGPVDVSTLA